MDTSRLKNVVIILLLILNAILAVGLAVIGGSSDAGSAAEASEQLAKLGIEADESVFGIDSDLCAYEVTRSAESERTVAEIFIGQSEMTETSGGTRLFTGPNGTVVFMRGGEVRMTVYDCGVNSAEVGNADETAKRVSSYLMSGGFSGDVKVSGTAAGSAAVCTTEVAQRINGVEVYNGKLMSTLTSSLLESSGRWLAPQASQLSETARSPGGLALNFAAAVTDEGGEVGRIISMRYVYYITSQDDASVSAIPACIIETDAGDWLLNALDGTIIAKL